MLARRRDRQHSFSRDVPSWYSRCELAFDLHLFPLPISFEARSQDTPSLCRHRHSYPRLTQHYFARSNHRVPFFHHVSIHRYPARVLRARICEPNRVNFPVLKELERIGPTATACAFAPHTQDSYVNRSKISIVNLLFSRTAGACQTVLAPVSIA